jgi:hypothetical protein
MLSTTVSVSEAAEAVRRFNLKFGEMEKVGMRNTNRIAFESAAPLPTILHLDPRRRGVYHRV